MKLTEILAVSGQSGLYRFIAQTKGGIIVENLENKSRMAVHGTSKVSSLGDIAVFTVEEDLPLGDVFQTIYDKSEGKETISHKSPDAEIKSTFASFLPQYDSERVRLSDMKKIFSWYNRLIIAGMTSFRQEEEETQTEAK